MTAVSNLPNQRAAQTVTDTDHLYLDDAGGTDYGVSAKAFRDHVLWKSGPVYVNQFYPDGYGPTGSTQPLSGLYGSLAAAQAVYPHATALTNELDWCALQAATNYVTTRDDTGTQNNASSRIILDGHYIINKTVMLHQNNLILEGVSGGQHRWAVGGETSIEYNGTAGDIDDPVYMMEFWTTDENGNPPSGLNGPPAVQPRIICQYITFSGSGGSIATEGAHNYVSALLIGRSAMTSVRDCGFGNGLYDGIVIRAPSIFNIFERNMFYGCNRDCIAAWNVQGQGGSFTTTTWIYNNEFGLYGRYAILLDYSGSVEAMPIIRDNSIEGVASNSWYHANHEHFVHGVVASFCYVNCGNLIDCGSRFEGTGAGATWGDIHIVGGGSNQTIENGTATNLIISRKSNTQARTNAAIAYQDTAGRKYLDITDTRNYRLGITGDVNGSHVLGGLTLRKLYNFNNILSVAVNGVDFNTDYPHFEDLPAINHWILPYKADTANSGESYVVEEEGDTTAIPTHDTALGHSVWTNAGTPYRHFGHFIGDGFHSMNSGVGNYRVKNAGSISDWAAATQYFAHWATPGGADRMLVKPTAENGFLYQATTAGTSHATTEPTWPTTIGGTVVDNTVTWTCIQQIPHSDENNNYETMDGSNRVKTGTAAPTTGRFQTGDKVMDTAPSAGGTVGWVCTTAGAPGTWKAFGSIAA